MKNVAKLVAPLALVALLLGSVASASPSLIHRHAGGSSAGPRFGGTLTVGVARDPATLNPIANGGYEANYMMLPVKARFVSETPSGKIVPDLAQSWTHPSRLKYIFKLRAGVRFSNGKLVTAADWKYSFDVMMSPKSLYAGIFAPYIKSWRVVNPHKFEVDLKTPWRFFLQFIAENYHLGVIPHGWLKQCGSKCDTTVIGAGPYELQRWAKGDELVLVRNPRYWNKKVGYVKKIVFKVVPDPEASIVQLETGEINLNYEVPLSDVKSLRANHKVHIFAHASGLLNEIIPNTAVAPFSDVRVRRAINMAINRSVIVRAALGGYGEVPTDLFPSFMPQHDRTSKGIPYKPAAAKQLLATAGYTASHPLSFTLTTINSSDFINQATIVKQQLAQIGVKVTVKPMDKASFLAPIFRLPGSDPKGWQAGLERYSFSDDPSQFAWDQFAKESFEDTVVNLKNPDTTQDGVIEKLANSALRAPTLKAERKLDKKLYKRFAHDALYFYLNFQKNIQASTTNVQGFRGSVASAFPLQYVWMK